MQVRILSFILFIATTLLVSPITALASTAQDYFREGYVASMKREWNVAIDLFNKAIDLNPENAAAYVQRASVYQMLDRIDDAIRDYQAALRLRPDYYLAMEYLANLYEIKNQYAKAIEVYSRALPLVKDQKWRSVIQWKISEARKKAISARVDRLRQ
ncbi:MAG: tetratricopeptide repeat protein [Deltaproteobacteria bacterium]|nr:tetratricopeptide repeat protein [Deltaproteobacteria bacterium]